LTLSTSSYREIIRRLSILNLTSWKMLGVWFQKNRVNKMKENVFCDVSEVSCLQNSFSLIKPIFCQKFPLHEQVTSFRVHNSTSWGQN
jgi:hypothetical protein